MAPTPPPLVVTLLVADVALAAAFVANHLAGQPHFAPTTKLLDLNGEANLPAWYSSMQWFCTALLFGVFAAKHVTVRVVRSWLLLGLPAVFALLSLDEVSQLHEWLGKRSDVLLPSGDREASAFKMTGIWMLAIGLPFLALFLALVYSLRRYFAGSRVALPLVCGGMGLMLFGAIGVETLSNFVAPGSWASLLQVTVEELAEMLGGTLILWGGLSLLAGHSLDFGPRATAPAGAARPAAAPGRHLPTAG